MAEFVINPEKRESVRYAVTGTPHVKLATKSGQEITFFIVDVSVKGVGIILADKLQKTEILMLEFLDDPRAIVELEVRWILACDNLNEISFGSEQLYRCGLFALAPNIDVLSLIKSCDGILVEALL